MVITLNTNAQQDAVLARLLTKKNSDRVAAGLAPLADISALVTLLVTESVQAQLLQQVSEDASAVSDVFVNSPARRAAIKTAAGLA